LANDRLSWDDIDCEINAHICFTLFVWIVGITPSPDPEGKGDHSWQNEVFYMEGKRLWDAPRHCGKRHAIER
jgi:hypothetical protein